MRKVLKESGRPCGEKRVNPKLTVVCLFVFWTFIKYLQEIFVQFWVQHGNFGLHVFVQHQGEDGEHGVEGGVPGAHSPSGKMTPETGCFTLFTAGLSSEMHHYRSYNFPIFPFLDFQSLNTEEMPEKRSSQMHLDSRG